MVVPERRERPGLSTRAAIPSLVGLLVLAYFLRFALLPFVIAAAIAFVLGPPIAWAQRRLHLPRLLVLLVAYALVVGLLAGAGWWLVTSVSGEIARLGAHAPETLGALLRKFVGDRIQLFGNSVDADRLARQMLSEAQHFLLKPSEAMTFAVLGLALIVGTILTFVLLFYFLFSGRRLARGMLWLVPPGARERVREVAYRAEPVLRRYIVGLVVIVAYTALVAWIGLGLFFGLPYAPLISLVVGFLELIPVVGPAISIALIGLSGVQQGSLWLLLGFMGFAVALRISIDQIVGPLVLGRAVMLHPVAVIFALLAGAILYGILGVLLAIPVATVSTIALAAWYGEDPRG